MKVKKIVGTGLLLCTCVYLFGACGQEQPAKSEKLYMGVACYNQSDTFVGEMIESLKKQVNDLGSDQFETALALRDAAGSQRTQDDQVKELIDAGCNVLCVNLVERADPSEIIDLARDNDVPIIFFNREPVSEDLLQWDKLYYVGADAKQSGVLQGELAADVVQADSQIDRNGDGKIQYVVLEGEQGHQDAIIRTENAVNTLKRKGVVLEKLSYRIANWNRAQAQNQMEQIFSQYSNKIELVLANNDDMALGAIDAYEKSNLTSSAFPVFVGIDGTAVGLQAVVDGKLAGTVYNDKEGQAEAMATLATALVSGKGMNKIKFKNDKYIYLPYTKVMKENAEDFLKK